MSQYTIPTVLERAPGGAHGRSLLAARHGRQPGL